MRIIKTNNIEVKIYKTKRSMRSALRRIGYNNVGYTESIVIPCDAYSYKDGKRKKLPLIGEVYIHEQATMPALVHETLHAATTLLRRNGADMNLSRRINKKEELLAYAQTSILQDVLKSFFPKKNSSYKLDDLNWWANGSAKASRKK